MAKLCRKLKWLLFFLGHGVCNIAVLTANRLFSICELSYQGTIES